jgi:hypothetical protein
MIPWYSVTYSDGLEHIFISWKLIGSAIGGAVIVFVLGWLWLMWVEGK